MTSAVPPAAASPPRGNQPSTEGTAAAAQGRAGGRGSTTALVLSQTRHGALIEAGARRWLVRGAPPLPPGATLSLELGAARGAERSGRVLAIRQEAGDERLLEPPLAIRLQPAPTARTVRPAPADAPRLQVDARPIGPNGHPVGSPVPIRLSVAGFATTDAGGQTIEVARGGQPVAGIPGQPAGQITAEVVGRDAAGRPLLQAAGLRLRLETPLDLPVGVRLQLVLPPGLAAAPSDGVAAAPGDAPWSRVIEALLLRPGEALEGALRLPAPDHALAARLLRWIEALGAGATAAAAEPDDPPAPAGEPGALLRAALTELGRQSREPQPGGWRVLLMPLGLENPIALKLYLRDLPVDPERHPRPRRDGQATAQRAIFELDLSRLGRCQLDVLCRAARLDLVVRTAAPLAAVLQDDIRSLVRAARELAGWTGALEFRVAELLPLPASRAAAGQQITA